MREHELEPSKDTGSPAVRRKRQAAGPTAEQAAILRLQRAVGNAGVSRLLQDEEESPVRDVLRSGGGQPLDADTRSSMESRLGADFSDVRVHTDGAASNSAEAINAQAYTAGSDIVFQQGRYEPGTEDGQRMLAHELTHVVQQRSGPVDGTPAEGGISVSHPSDRFERAAESAAQQAVAQRQEEEEELQMSVQRQEEEEEELQMAVQRQEEDEVEDEELG